MPTKRTKKSSQRRNNAKDVYEKAVEAMSKEKKEYLEKRFASCHPQAAKISKEFTDTVWTDAMQIMQDYPSEYTKGAAVCFFAFVGEVVDTHLGMRFAKEIRPVDLPVLLPSDAKSDMIKTLVKRAEDECNKTGAELIKNLLLRDFGYFFAVLKAIQIQNIALHNLIISGYRMWVFEVMIPHLFRSEKKGE